MAAVEGRGCRPTRLNKWASWSAGARFPQLRDAPPVLSTRESSVVRSARRTLYTAPVVERNNSSSMMLEILPQRVCLAQGLVPDLVPIQGEGRRAHRGSSTGGLRLSLIKTTGCSREQQPQGSLGRPRDSLGGVSQAQRRRVNAVEIPLRRRGALWLACGSRSMVVWSPPAGFSKPSA